MFARKAEIEAKRDELKQELETLSQRPQQTQIGSVDEILKQTKQHFGKDELLREQIDALTNAVLDLNQQTRPEHLAYATEQDALSRARIDYVNESINDYFRSREGKKVKIAILSLAALHMKAYQCYEDDQNGFEEALVAMFKQLPGQDVFQKAEAELLL